MRFRGATIGVKSFLRASCAVGLLLIGISLVSRGQEKPPVPKPDIPAASWARIEDDKPLRNAAENKDEFSALNALVLLARKVAPDVLAENALPGVTGRELFGDERAKYRGQIVHVVGRLTRLRAMESNGFLANEGVKKLYEAWVQDDTTPEFPLCVIVSEIPEQVKPAEEIKNVYVNLDGFFLKRLKVREDNRDVLAPLVIGRGLRRDASTEPPAKTPLELGDPRMDCPRAWLDHIEDDQRVMGINDNGGDEYNAYNFFVLHARKVPHELLAKHARKELNFRALFQADRAKYRGEIVHVTGKLMRLEWIGSNSSLEAAGVKDLWEAWIFEEIPNGNPTCVVLTELPEGVTPGPLIHDTRASCDAYFFKRYLYEAREENGRKVMRLAPLAIGRSMKVSSAPPPTGSASSYEALLKGIVPVGIGLVAVLGAALIGLTIWFRRGDRQVRQRLNELKSQTMFRDGPPPDDFLQN